MKGFKITSGALWALLGALLASAFVTHNFRGMLAFTPASQTAVARERTAANQSPEFMPPAQCDEYSRPMRVRLPSETPVAMLLQASHEGLSEEMAQRYVDGWRNRVTNVSVTAPQVMVTGNAWVNRNSAGPMRDTWSPPQRVLGGRSLHFLGLADLIKANRAAQWSVRRHDVYTIDVPTGVRPVNTRNTTWTLAPLRDLPDGRGNGHARPDNTDRYTADVTTGSGIKADYVAPTSGQVTLASLFTATTAPAPTAPTGLIVASRTTNWKVYAIGGTTITIPRDGFQRSVPTACAAITEVATTINTPSDGQRRRLVGLISRLDGADADPSAGSDLQHVVFAAKEAVTAKLNSPLDEELRAVAAANHRADYYKGLYDAMWSFFMVRLPMRVATIEQYLIGGNMGTLFLAIIITLLALDMRRKLSKLPPAPPSESMITEIQYAFLASMEAELFQLLSFVRANIAAGHEDYNWVHKDLTQRTLISALMEDPSRLLRLARLVAEGEIKRLGPRHTPSDPIGHFIDNTLFGAIRELCLSIIAAAEIKKVPAPDASLAALIGVAVAALPHALNKAGEKALSKHVCTKAEVSKPDTGMHRAAGSVEVLCHKVLALVGEKVNDGTPLVDIVNAATSALNKALKKAFDDGAASRDGAIKHYEDENRKAAALISSLEDTLTELKKEFIAIFEAFFPGEQLALTSRGYITTPFQASHRMEKALEALRTGTTGSVALDVAISALRWLRDNNSKGPKQRMAHIKRGLGETMSVAEATGATREDQPQTHPLGAVYVEAATEASNPEKVENDKDAADVVVAAKEIDLSNPGAVVTDEPGNGRDRSGARLSQSSPATPSTEVSSSS